jgi:hypothetical protein
MVDGGVGAVCSLHPRLADKLSAEIEASLFDFDDGGHARVVAIVRPADVLYGRGLRAWLLRFR